MRLPSENNLGMEEKFNRDGDGIALLTQKEETCCRKEEEIQIETNL